MRARPRPTVADDTAENRAISGHRRRQRIEDKLDERTCNERRDRKSGAFQRAPDAEHAALHGDGDGAQPHRVAGRHADGKTEQVEECDTIVMLNSERLVPATISSVPWTTVTESTRRIGRRGPRHVLISRPPSSIPMPPTQSTPPSAAGDAKLSTNGVMQISTMPSDTLMNAKKPVRPSSSGVRTR